VAVRGISCLADEQKHPVVSLVGAIDSIALGKRRISKKAVRPAVAGAILACHNDAIGKGGIALFSRQQAAAKKTQLIGSNHVASVISSEPK
jgi:hypothetical protein